MPLAHNGTYTGLRNTQCQMIQRKILTCINPIPSKAQQKTVRLTTQESTRTEGQDKHLTDTNLSKPKETQSIHTENKGLSSPRTSPIHQ